MREFIDEIVAEDKTIIQQGTDMNRAVMMGIQGMDDITTVFNADGSITQTNGIGQVKTISFDNGMIVKFVGDKTITKKITIEDDYTTVKEVLL